MPQVTGFGDATKFNTEKSVCSFKKRVEEISAFFLALTPIVSEAIFLAIEKNTVIGYIDVTYYFEKNEIYDLWVDESFQGKGYEQALLQAAIDMNMPKKMMVLVDVDNLSETEMSKSVGFEIVPGTKSRYASYNC